MISLQAQMEETKQCTTRNIQLARSRVNVDNQKIVRNSILTVPIVVASTVQFPHHHTENAEQFKQYCSTIGEMLEKVHSNQLVQLKNKYRFYLSKVEKLEKVRNQLENKFERLEQIVNESPPVREETDSIEFIKKISSETQKKLNALQTKVTKQKEYYKESMKQIQTLKQKLKKEKDKFFELKRLGLKINSQFQASQKANKLENANKTFINIVNQKVTKNKEKIQGRFDVQRSPSNSGSESMVKQINLTQISSRLSSLQLMQNKFLKEQLSLIDKFNKDHKLNPKRSQQLPNIESKGNPRESFNEILFLKNTQKQKNSSMKNCANLARKNQCQSHENNAMWRSEGFQHYNRNQTKMKSQFLYKQQDTVNASQKDTNNQNNVIKSKRDKIMISQLNKIQKMKQELIKQAEQIEHEQQILKVCHLGKKNTNHPKFTISKLKSNAQNVLEPLEKLVKQHRTLCKNQEKQCQACERNMEKIRISQQKFSLHKTDIKKLKKKLQSFDERKSVNVKQCIQSDHRVLQKYDDMIRHETDQNEQKFNPDSLIIGDETLNDINQVKEEKEAFLNMTAEQTLRKIVDGKKIYEVLRLMQKENVYIPNSKKVLKYIK